MKRIASVLITLLLTCSGAVAQVLLHDDFSGGTASIPLNWTVSSTPGSFTAPTSTFAQLIGGNNDRKWATHPINAVSEFSPVLSTNTCLMEWSAGFRMPYTMTTAGTIGFANTESLVAYVLAGSSSDLTTGNGYALVLGDYNTGTSWNRVSLVRYTGGLDNAANITTIISAPFTVQSIWIGLRVTYDPNTDTWSIYSGNSNNPQNAATALGASAVDAVYTSVPLGHLGLLHNYRVPAPALFDNIYIPGCNSVTTIAFGGPQTSDVEDNMANRNISVVMSPVSSTPVTFTVNLSSSTGTTFGLNPDDYVFGNAASLIPTATNPTSATFIMPANQSSMNIVLQVQDDPDILNDDLIMQIVGASGGVQIGSQDTHTVLIIDDDAPPATLNIGDFAIVGINAHNLCNGGNTSDEISFFCFQPITNGTVLDLTDNAYERTTANIGLYAQNEGRLRITRTGGTIPAGTVVTMQILNGSVTWISPDANWSAAPYNSLNMTTAGDQLLILQGGNWSGTGYNVDYTGGIALAGFSTTTNGWQSFGNSSSRSGIPSGLDCFVMAPLTNSSYNKFDPAVMPPSADQRTWMNMINDPTNWVSYNTGGSNTANCNLYHSSGPQYSAGYTFDISSTGFTAGLWRGNEDNDWFNCRNWDNAQVPDATTDVLLDQRSVNSAHVDASQTAACNKLTIAPFAGHSVSVRNGSNLQVNDDLELDRPTGSFGQAELEILANSTVVVSGDLSIAGIANQGFNNGGTSRLTMPDAGCTLSIDGSLTIENGGFIDMRSVSTPGATISVKQDWINNISELSFFEGSGTVELDGTVNQTIGGAMAGAPSAFFASHNGEEQFSHLEINKTSGDVLMPNNVRIEDYMLFDNGIVQNTGILKFRTLSVASSASDQSYAEGVVERYGPGDFTFPVGDSGYYRPLQIMNVTGMNSNRAFACDYVKTDPSLVYNDNSAATLDHISHCEYWTLDRVNATAQSAMVELSWNANTSCGVTATADLRVARFDGSIWQDEGNGFVNGNPATTGIVRSLGVVNQFSPFTLASVSTANPLPVELLSFVASPETDYVQLDWTTVSEVNNDHFDVERSTNGWDFIKIDEVAGNGTTNSTIEYQSIDRNPYDGVSYYRLKQFDFDGSYAYSTVASVEYKSSTSFHAWSNGTSLIIRHQYQGAAYRILDASGRMVRSGNLRTANNEELSLNGLVTGIYTLLVDGNQGSEIVRFVH